MIRALVFDFDGLIIDTESALIASYAEVYARHGVPFERELFVRSVGQADYTFDPWHPFEKRADRAALEAERWKRNRELDLTLPILPGVVALMDEARQAGLPLGLASNSTHGHVDKNLKRLGLLDRFAFVACREDAASPKPEPDLYRLVVTKLGVRPSQAVALEDSATGVRAAKRAGLKVVAVPNSSTRHQDLSQADLIVASLAEVTLERLQKA